jgi:acyl-lipid omega-6 desaturase (Delta-12 desaturase)
VPTAASGAFGPQWVSFQAHDHPALAAAAPGPLRMAARAPIITTKHNNEDRLLSHTPAEPSKRLVQILARYKQPSTARSVWQFATSFVPFLLVWAAMLKSLEYSYWITLSLALLASGFLLRLFMIQHDCGHGSFFKSQKLNNAVGAVIGVMTLVPYDYWRKTHAIHHKTSGDLDHRTFGDIVTLTVKEYEALSPWGRIRYRIYRNPLVMLGLGPAYQFILKHRFPADIPRTWKREWASVHKTNVALALILVVAWQTIGLDRFLLVQVPITLFSGAIGVFLFYVQHQFEDTYWQHHEAWDFFDAGIQGSSHYALPKVLQWFTANIGLHHIHHVSSKIPNYRLQQCFDENPEFRRVTTLTLGESLKCLFLSLWDEDQSRLVSFRHLRAARAS